MKITLSKARWEEMGKKAGWVKEAQSIAPTKTECQQCHGNKFIIEKLKNRGTLDYVERRSVCPMCKGKGYTDEKDQHSYLHSIGVKPHKEE